MTHSGASILILVILTLVTVPLTAQPPGHEMIKQMMADWKNTDKYKPAYHTDKEKEYFKQCSAIHRIYPADDDDDYYNVDGNYGLRPKAGEDKKRCTKKELRMMTREEQLAWSAAYRSWNAAPVDPTRAAGRTEHEVFVDNHRYTRAEPAHYGVCFLLWHDAFLELHEEALRKHNDTVCPPYWDSTLDQCLRNPHDSVLWSVDMLGERHGQVRTGLLANLTIRPADCRQSTNELYTYRSVIASGIGRAYLMQDGTVESMYSRAPDNFSQLCYPRYPWLEDTHGYGHMWVGGAMGPLACSPNEPMFWAHHENINRMFKNYLRDHPMDEDRSKYYPDWPELPPYQRANATLKPFDEVYPGITCSTRLDKKYDTWSLYQPPPKDCQLDEDCGSVMLWCMPNCNGRRRCSAKLKEGAPCDGYPVNACYKPVSCVGKSMTCEDMNTGEGKICTCNGR